MTVALYVAFHIAYISLIHSKDRSCSSIAQQMIQIFPLDIPSLTPVAVFDSFEQGEYILFHSQNDS